LTGFLLDTSAISEFAKREPNLGFLTWAREVDPARIHLSAITIGELWYGIALSHEAQRARLETWLSHEVLPEFGLRILAFDASVSARCGALRASARRAGRTLSALDAAIAATAMQFDLTLISRIEREFSHAGVPTFNPWS
jgi:predicted nucleic acid-binding protein